MEGLLRLFCEEGLCWTRGETSAFVSCSVPTPPCPSGQGPSPKDTPAPGTFQTAWCGAQRTGSRERPSHGHWLCTLFVTLNMLRSTSQVRIKLQRDSNSSLHPGSDKTSFRLPLGPLTCEVQRGGRQSHGCENAGVCRCGERANLPRWRVQALVL